MTPFSYGFVGSPEPDRTSVKFKDAEYILPDWVLAVTRYHEMDDVEQERFRRGCKRLDYKIFLEQCRSLIVTQQTKFDREVLNDMQGRFIGKHFERLKRDVYLRIKALGEKF